MNNPYKDMITIFARAWLARGSVNTPLVVCDAVRNLLKAAKEQQEKDGAEETRIQELWRKEGPV